MYDYERIKKANDLDSMATYFETFVTTLTDALDAAMGAWNTHVITISNTGLEGHFEGMSRRKDGAKMQATFHCDGKAVRIVATMTLGDGTVITEKAGGSVSVGANAMGAQSRPPPGTTHHAHEPGEPSP